MAYRTLEQDLTEAFEKRGIKVIEIKVEKGATLYTIKVER